MAWWCPIEFVTSVLNLTTMEEAWAFAREVEVEVDGETISYSDYVREVSELVHKPSQNHPDVKDVSSSVGKSGKYVSERLRFLTLPETARRLALKENIEREDLTTMEEAWAFGREIDVRVCRKCGKTVKREGHEHPVDVQPMAKVSEKSQVIIQIPGENHQDVRSLADDIEPSASYIRDTISYLTLPEDVHPLIDAGDLTKRAARMLARVKSSGCVFSRRATLPVRPQGQPSELRRRKSPEGVASESIP